MDREPITSGDNRLIKYTRCLLTRKGREKEGRFIVEGLRLVREALSRPELVDYILVAEKAVHYLEVLSLPAKVRCYSVSERVLETVADTHNPAGILAVCYKPEWGKACFADTDGLLLILDNVRDPGNLGTILRTAWAASVDAVLLMKGTVDIYNGKVVRSTMGAILHLPVFQKVQPRDILKLRAQGYRFIMADPRGTELFYQTDYRGKIALVLGGETTGVSSFPVQDLPVAGVRIPLREGVDSLNAAVACGIILYAAWQQRIGL